MKKFITYQESLNILENLDIPIKAFENVFLCDSLGRVLAHDIVADHNNPKFATSAMDGYAIRFEDQNLQTINIVDNNPAGTVVHTEVSRQTAIKTFTGALMPQGADTLIPIENVTVENNTIKIVQEVPKGFAIRQVGESYFQGDVLIKKGTILDYAHIGVMAGLNIVHVPVYQKPRVTIASTGSEILDLGEPQTNDSQIRSSNHITLQALCMKHGASVNQNGTIQDDKESILDFFKNAITHSDIVVTTGGVSVGDYDFVKDIIKDKLGCEVLFQGVNIKPGQHILIAKKENTIIIGLPGFAYSSTVTCLLYVLPILYKFKGSNESLQLIEALLEENIIKKGNKTTFKACNLVYKSGQYTVNFEGKKEGTSAILTNLLGDCGLVVIDENTQQINKGERVKVLKI